MDTIERSRLAEIAEEVKAEHGIIVKAPHKAYTHALKVGALLLEARALVKHGEWIPWVYKHCAFSDRMALHYMKIADNRALLESKSETIFDLSISQALGVIRVEEFERKYEAGKKDALRRKEEQETKRKLECEREVKRFLDALVTLREEIKLVRGAMSVNRFSLEGKDSTARRIGLVIKDLEAFRDELLGDS
jgi:hypothetical protein